MKPKVYSLNSPAVLDKMYHVSQIVLLSYHVTDIAGKDRVLDNNVVRQVCASSLPLCGYWVMKKSWFYPMVVGLCITLACPVQSIFLRKREIV